MLGVGGIGVLGDGMAGHLAGEGGVALAAAGGQLNGGPGAQPMDRGTDDDVRQRHPFGGADDGGDQAHAATPWFMYRPGGSGKNLLVRAW